MMSKTYFAVGLATSLAVIQPNTFTECAVAFIGGTIGGVLADNDILDNDYQADALIGQLLAFGAAALALVLDFFFGFGICQSIIEKPLLPIIGGIGLTVIIQLAEMDDISMGVQVACLAGSLVFDILMCIVFYLVIRKYEVRV